MSKRFPAVFLNHGGGPLPLLDDAAHRNLVKHLRSLPQRFPKPEVILLASAHWETPDITFVGGEDPGLLYDYYGFPPESYEVKYPCKNSLSLVEKARKLLSTAGLKSSVDPKRRYDHGVFVPLKLMYPEANIPVVQLSLPVSRDPALVYRIGQALSPLRSEGVLFIGSGLSFHNLPSFFSSDRSKLSRSREFDDALKSAMTSEDSRKQKLVGWSNFPQARFCHPQEDHLMPLLFVAGAGDGETCTIIYEDELMGAKISGFQLG